MVLLIDNYDSFSYNLYQMIGEIMLEESGTEGDPDASRDPDIRVVRNDAITVEEIDRLRPQGIILSPGPGTPKEAGVCIETVKKLGSRYLIMGVCLGHQSICEAYGATVGHAKRLMHGKKSICSIDTECPLFSGLPDQIEVGRYHSLAAIETTMPSCLKVTGRTDDGEIMAVCHESFPVYGIQFHPESILTPMGSVILRNFVKLAQENSFSGK